jgi:hypothetical protein
MKARVTKVAMVSARFSKSLTSRRFRPNQGKVLEYPAARQDDEALRVVGLGQVLDAGVARAMRAARQVIEGGNPATYHKSWSATRKACARPGCPRNNRGSSRFSVNATNHCGNGGVDLCIQPAARQAHPRPAGNPRHLSGDANHASAQLRPKPISARRLPRGSSTVSPLIGHSRPR